MLAFVKRSLVIMRRPFASLLIVCALFLLAACGKLTPTAAATLIDRHDQRTYFIEIRTGKHEIGELEEKLRKAGLTEFHSRADALGNEETEIALTKRGWKDLADVHADTCGAGCWKVPLGERTNVSVTELKGLQHDSEQVTFTWELDPNEIGHLLAITPTRYVGHAEFKEANGKWTLVSMEDGAPSV